MSFDPFLQAALGAATVAYALVQVLLAAYSSHRWVVLWRAARGRAAGVRSRDAHVSGGVLPSVTVQLPVYDERAVIERLVGAAAALDWPRDRLEIQVLDDSTDDTRELAARAIERHRAAGVPIVHR